MADLHRVAGILASVIEALLDPEVTSFEDRNHPRYLREMSKIRLYQALNALTCEGVSLHDALDAHRLVYQWAVHALTDHRLWTVAWGLGYPIPSIPGLMLLEIDIGELHEELGLQAEVAADRPPTFWETIGRRLGIIA